MTEPVTEPEVPETPAVPTIDPNAPVEVAGLIVPAHLVPRIIAALRGVYGQITQEFEDDEEAVQAVLQFWITQVMQSFEGMVAEQKLGDELEKLREKAYEERDKAREKAAKDAEKILKKAKKKEDLPTPEGDPDVVGDEPVIEPVKPSKKVTPTVPKPPKVK